MKQYLVVLNLLQIMVKVVDIEVLFQLLLWWKCCKTPLKLFLGTQTPHPHTNI